MGADTWGRVKQLFDAALPLPPAERHRFLNTECSHPAILQEVLSLLAVHDEDPEFLNSAAPTFPKDAVLAPSADQHVGPWRLVREIGRGGMGIVWEAERADGGFSQRVAIKFVQCPVLGELEAVRLTQERSILARLNHPGIARLIDGGATDQGSPYLVMEYVQGEPLDAWCDARHLSIRDRMQVFLAVCAPVEYAHRHLVVHRDLKPANILITTDGAPKLLDFGIAKLIDAQSERTSTAARLLTPDYASPEQIRGEPVTTTADVYSLGVVLYVLVCGRKPYQAEGTSPLDLMRAICEQDPPPPSSLNPDPQLTGEVNAIVLQALRKNPDERYPSVRALSDDITAWLDCRPVTAHRDSWFRRIRKLARRNRVATFAATLALLSLIGGSALAGWQARVATQERVRAENRFREVRQFSRSLLFELHNSIQNLSGATAARNLLLARATQFLDGLAQDAGSDAALKIELAEGYRRLGHVQGSNLSDNLGQTANAMASFHKAVRFGEEALASAPDYLEAALVLTGAYDDLTDAAYMKGDVAQADAWFTKHRDLISAIERRPPLTSRTQVSVATSYASLGYYRALRGDLAGAKGFYQQAVDRFATLAHHGDRSKQLRSQYPFALKRLGAVLISEGDLLHAEQRYREALAIEDAVLASDPANNRLRIDRTMTQSDLALILKKQGDHEGAIRTYEEILATRAAALSSDPDNQRLLNLTAGTQSNLAALYSSCGRHQDAIRLATESVRLRDAILAKTKSPRDATHAAGARVSLAERYLDAVPPSPSRARKHLLDARSTIETLRRTAPTSPLEKSVIADFDSITARLPH